MPLIHTVHLIALNVDTSNPHDKFLLHNQFVVWHCKGCSIVPLSEYANNSVFQELRTRSKYFTSTDEEIFIDLRRVKGYTNEIEKLNRNDKDLTITFQLKVPVEKIMRLRVTGYYQAQYLYSMMRERLIMNYKEYGVNKQKQAIS